MFTAATGLAILHVLDDAFIGKQPGTTAGDHLPAAGVLLVVLGGSLALYPRLGPVLGRHENVSFETDDGLTLRGRYLGSRTSMPRSSV